MATRNGWMVRLFDADRARVEALAKRYHGVEIPITAVVRSAILAAVQAAGIDDPAEPKCQNCSNGTVNRPRGVCETCHEAKKPLKKEKKR